jgi:hypothetical protein
VVVTTCPALDVNTSGAGSAMFDGIQNVKATIGSYKKDTEDVDMKAMIKWCSSTVYL